MKIPRFVLLALCAALLLIAGVSSLEAREHRQFRAGQLTAMTQNLYVGGDILLPLSATDAQDFQQKAAMVIGQILATNFPERATKLGELILAEEPALIGLQEVYVIKICLDPLLLNCPFLDQDYLEILLDNLNVDGDRYREVATVTNIDLQGLPAVLPNGLQVFIGLTDRDVTLARHDVETRNAVAANFGAAFPVDNPLLPGFDRVLRGYTMVDATLRGRDYHFVNTHFEVSGGNSPAALLFRAVQAAQAAELVQTLALDDNVQVLVGDFNSSPDDGPLVDCVVPDGAGGFLQTLCPTPYAVLAQAGYVDVWEQRGGPWAPGDTCCQATLLDNAASLLDERIDLVWVRQAPDHFGGPVVRGVRAEVVGAEIADKTVNGLWPSDHAGVAARMTLRTPR